MTRAKVPGPDGLDVIVDRDADELAAKTHQVFSVEVAVIGVRLARHGGKPGKERDEDLPRRPKSRP